MLTRIKDEIYFGNVIVCDCTKYSVKKVVDELIRNKYIKSDESVTSLGLDRPDIRANTTEYYMNGVQYIIVFIYSKDLVSIAHECVHIMNMIFQLRKVTYDYENDEHVAYYVGYLFKNIFEVINRGGKQNGRNK